MSEENLNETEMAARFPGIDVPKALKRFKGNTAFFVRMLKMFESHYAGSGADIRKALEEGDMKTAGRLSHTLKGVAINLDAWGMFAAARALDTAVKDGESAETLDRLFAEFETEFNMIQASAKGLVRHFETNEP